MKDNAFQVWLDRHRRGTRLHPDLDNEVLYRIGMGLATRAEEQAARALPGVDELLDRLRPNADERAAAEAAYDRALHGAAAVGARTAAASTHSSAGGLAAFRIDLSFTECLTVIQMLEPSPALGTAATSRTGEPVERLLLWSAPDRQDAATVKREFLERYRRASAARFQTNAAHPKYVQRDEPPPADRRLDDMRAAASKAMATPAVGTQPLAPALALAIHRSGAWWLVLLFDVARAGAALDDFFDADLDTRKQRSEWAKEQRAWLFFLADPAAPPDLESSPP